MRILFSSYHNYLDPTSGAAISTRSTLIDLVESRNEVNVFCGDFFDAPHFGEEVFLEYCWRQGIDTSAQDLAVEFEDKRYKYDLISFDDSGVKGTAVFNRTERGQAKIKDFLSFAFGQVFLNLFRNELKRFTPDVYVTYGGYWAARYAANAAKVQGVETIFMLHNLAYENKDLFSYFDKVIVPSEFAQRRYKAKLGIDSIVLPPLIDEKRCVARELKPTYVTFINPSPEKGLYFFLGIALELNKRRPDIPLMVVESRTKFDVVASIPAARRLKNLFYSKSVANPAEIYAQTKVLLVPSLCEETFGRVAVEASLNGVPALCSNRGALPEVLGDCGLICEIPKNYSPDTRSIPTSAEVKPWVDAIISLWDDDVYRCELQTKLKESSRRYSYAQVSQTTREVFGVTRSAK